MSRWKLFYEFFCKWLYSLFNNSHFSNYSLLHNDYCKCTSFKGMPITYLYILIEYYFVYLFLLISGFYYVFNYFIIYLYSVY